MLVLCAVSATVGLVLLVGLLIGGVYTVTGDARQVYVVNRLTGEVRVCSGSLGGSMNGCSSPLPVTDGVTIEPPTGGKH